VVNQTAAVHSEILKMNGRAWTIQDKKLITELYPDSSASHIAQILNRSIKSIYTAAREMGLKKSDAFNNSVKSGRINVLSTAAALKRFQPGIPPYNKGLKLEDYLSIETIIKIRGTQFKKGNAPANLRPIGSIRIDRDGYSQIKVKAGRMGWMLLHRYTWEQENGPIPENMNIMFADGNRSNCKLENLLLRTKAECMEQNTICRYPAELRRSIRIIKRLEKIIIETNN